MSHFFHLTARTHPPHTPLDPKHTQACAHLWEKLRRRFPDALACVLMPNHLHLITQAQSPQTAKRALATELRAWTRKFHPGKSMWEQLPVPELIPDSLHLRRQIRYVHLNPCRSALARDPLEWEWSTHQDATGCVADPWPNLVMLAQLMDTPLSRLPETIHRYVSGDPSVAVGGTPGVRAPRAGESYVADYEHILSACAMATRRAPTGLRNARRDLAVQVSAELKLIPDPAALKMTRFSWSRSLKKPAAPEAIQAVLRILGDRRLLLGSRKSQRG